MDPKSSFRNFISQLSSPFEAEVAVRKDNLIGDGTVNETSNVQLIYGLLLTCICSLLHYNHVYLYILKFSQISQQC